MTTSSVDNWHRGVTTNIRMPIILGIGVLVTCLGGFGLWAGLAPLDGAVVVSGSFVATGQNKYVQHLEGGILRDLLTKEGDLVEAGQTLMRLDATAANAKLRRLLLKRHRLVILRARLEAELKGQERLQIPADIDVAEDAEIRAIFERQVAELEARRRKLSVETEVLKREIAGLQEGIQGYKAQAKSTTERLSLFNEELRDKQKLLERQLVRKTEVLAVRRAEAGLSGELGELTARVADANERISRAEQQIAQVRSAAIQKALEELRATETELDDIQEQIRAAQDVMNRIDIRAPVRGIVVKLHQQTPGGVIGSGAVILEMVPVNDELIIEARVNPNEIWHVKTGQQALVRLSALNQRLTPMIQAKVIYLSADVIGGQNGVAGKTERESPTRTSYVVRVRLDQSELRQKVADFAPTPGMPADVFIKTGQRTFFDYMMRPVSDSFSRAFREN